MKLRILHHRRPIAKSKAWRFAQRFFMVLGLLAVGFAAYSYAARYVYQTYESWQFDGSLARRALAARIPKTSPLQPPAPITPQSVVGRIAIPRLGISAIVEEGADDRTLDLAVGHISSTALPGQAGNVGLAAHRDNLFRNLKDVKRDDTITLTTLDGSFEYRVVSFRVVKPTDVSVLDPSPEQNTLTLVTCYPFYFVGHAPWRFIVKARQVAGTAQSHQTLVATAPGRA